MKTEAIKQSIISNYNILSERAKIKQTNTSLSHIWGLNYKNQGFVDQLGSIERKGIKIDIREGKVITCEKPLFTTQKRALKKINKMLEEIIANFNNEDAIKKGVLNILCFPKEKRI